MGSLQVQYSSEVLENAHTLLVAMKEQPVFRDLSFSFSGESRSASRGLAIEQQLRRFAKGARTSEEMQKLKFFSSQLTLFQCELNLQAERVYVSLFKDSDQILKFISPPVELGFAKSDKDM